MKHANFIIGIVIVACVGFGIFLLYNAGSVSFSSEDKPNIVVAHPTLASFVESIAGDTATVTTIIDAQTDPLAHTYSPADERLLPTADALVVGGAGTDAWATTAQAAQHKPDRVLVVAQTLTEAPVAGSAFWLSPKTDIAVTTSIKNDVAALVPKHATESTRRADALADELMSLDEQYKKVLEGKIVYVPDQDYVLAYAQLAHDYDVVFVVARSPQGTTAGTELQTHVATGERVADVLRHNLELLTASVRDKE